MTRAILLAAGQGTRLRPYTDDRPKCLVEYQGRPILEHIIETLNSCGITDVIVVTGYRNDCLSEYGTVRIHNDAYAATNMVSTLFCASDWINDDVIISYTDIVYRPRILSRLLESDAPISVAYDVNWRELWEERMEDPLSDAETFKLDEKGCIRELGKKPSSFGDIEGQYMGLFRLKEEGCKSFVEHYKSLDVNAIYDGKDFPNMYMTSFIQSLINTGYPVKGVQVEGGWTEIDSPEDLKYDLPN